MTKADSPTPDDPEDDDFEVTKVHWAWRAVSLVLGAAGLTFGTLAVFKTDVEAGPVALLGVGLVFAIIAIAGQAPWRIKVGETEIELQKERRRRIRAEAAAIDTAATVKPAEQPQAVEVVQRVQQTNPQLGSSMRAALGYEATVIAMIERIVQRRGDKYVSPVHLIFDADTPKTPSFQPVLFDGMIERTDGERKALIEIKASTRDVTASWINVLHDRFVRGVNQYGAQMLLFITREPLNRNAGMRILEFSDKVWVQVSGPQDEQALETAIDRLIGQLYWEESEEPNG